MAQTFMILGGIGGFLSVALGAFAAHGLKGKLSDNMLANFQTGAQYQMYHAFALVMTAVLLKVLGTSTLLTAAGWLFLVGIVLFSGSLYALSLSGVRKLGAITPLGGLAFLAGWACLFIYGIIWSV
ncbi:DUF423 domain-containing protein [Brevibacillus laterosporus]|uniref:DUF423 domain-containing protein n=1 Tax=Brevibacillus laterosporus LMG 15441 TaxID=1042163 RepID=A0A075R195_BRELA|nr:DUF423 domain-containing protein [Brevibacillus laterosporus]AIG25216.1 hypothetical protein BRLA_c008750 [Brevibacillus laterosporus LMG 15441]RJL08557.1 DUF423 domain-containing protein [Brevibacillus laterosporus]TPH14487.1 DUF423 domain-containing protein [Brevibacillus laterosporus]HAS01448.1 DUF423 domain-containing protein [Brevibacillus sp.]